MKDLKDLYKPGRPIDEYLKPDGTLKIHCFTCIHRWNVREGILGDFLCKGGKKKHTACNPKYGLCYFEYDFLLWEPRVDINSFINEDDFKID